MIGEGVSNGFMICLFKFVFIESVKFIAAILVKKQPKIQEFDLKRRVLSNSLSNFINKSLKTFY